MFKYFTCVISIFISALAYGQQRTVQSVNSNWRFHKGKVNMSAGTSKNWSLVSLPHSWNKEDVMDDEPGYYRGEGWYKKTINIDPSWKDKSVYLYFEGANQVTDVFINGKEAGKHIGGYTAFSFPVNKFLDFSETGSNEIWVKVDNSYNDDIPPLDADFTFYGGIYRDVYLIVAGKVHFDMDNEASDGVFVTTPQVSKNAATVHVRGKVTNTQNINITVGVQTILYDHEGKKAASAFSREKIKSGGNADISQDLSQIKNPHLWSPDNPYLYQLKSVIVDVKTGKLLDEFSTAVGLRWFSFTAKEGFILNGKSIKLIGANRHQDYKHLANALPDQLHERDMQLLKDMGANFIRISHYPQDPAILQACDRLGLVASVETPEVNRITESNAFAENALHMQSEMIRQGYNHPSVMIWAYMNEILLRPKYNNNSPERAAYIKHVAELAQQLEDLTRKEDPKRYTMIPCHGNFNLYHEAGITRIPKIVGWNLYQGWYGGKFADLDKFIEKHHKELPDKPMIITEFGADADSRLRSFNPQKFDKTMEYAMRYHQYYLKTIKENPVVTGAAIWNMVEFNSEGRSESWPHMNYKGIMTWDRKPKDAYLFYQSQLQQKPVVNIGSKLWDIRSGFAESDDRFFCRQPVQVYSNQLKVNLMLNGQSLGDKQVVNGVAEFDVPFINGKNYLKATANGVNAEDLAVIDFQVLSPDLKSTKHPFKQLNINLGDHRIYTDSKLKQVWLPEQAYRTGSWGYVGGKVYRLPGKPLVPYGTNKNIKNTGDDPLYQTQRVGLSDFRLDVPDGRYEITLLFAEFNTGNNQAVLAYNLGEKTETGKREFRNFSVSINDTPFLNNFGNQNDLIGETAVSKKTFITVNNGKGIDIHFSALKGEPILNAVEVKRIF